MTDFTIGQLGQYSGALPTTTKLEAEIDGVSYSVDLSQFGNISVPVGAVPFTLTGDGVLLEFELPHNLGTEYANVGLYRTDGTKLIQGQHFSIEPTTGNTTNSSTVRIDRYGDSTGDQPLTNGDTLAVFVSAAGVGAGSLPLLIDAVALGHLSTSNTAAENDTGWEAVAALVSTNPGSHVVVKPGTYPVSSPEWTGVTDFTADLTSAMFQTETASTAPPWRLTDCERFDITAGQYAYETVNNNRAAASAGIWLQGCADFTIDRAKVVSSRGTGIQLQDCTRYHVQDCVVAGTLADGIYQREGCTLGHVHDNTLNNTGDDSITVASYVDDGSACSDIWIYDNHTTASQSRGMTISGTRIRIRANTIVSPQRHGIYLHTEVSNNGFYALVECEVDGNTIDGYGQDQAQAHGIFLNAGNATHEARDNKVRDNTVNAGFAATANHGIRVDTQSGTAAHHTRCTVAGNEVSGAGGYGIQASVTDPTVDRNIVRTCGLGGIRFFGAGTARCRANDAADLNTTSTASTPGITFIESGAAVICHDNTVLDSAGRLANSIVAAAPTSGVVRNNWTPDAANSLNGSLVTT